VGGTTARPVEPRPAIGDTDVTPRELYIVHVCGAGRSREERRHGRHQLPRARGRRRSMTTRSVASLAHQGWQPVGCPPVH